jgi:hypothetical protein
MAGFICRNDKLTPAISVGGNNAGNAFIRFFGQAHFSGAANGAQGGMGAYIE